MKGGRRMKTLVVGGGGFIGGHLARLLIGSGHRDVTILGRSPVPRFGVVDGVRYISGDAADPVLIAKLLCGCDELIDLAYGTVPKTSFEDPIHDLLVNLPATVSLLRQAGLANVGKVLMVSSGGTVYGNAEYLPIDERHPTNPVSPYGITKLATEKYAQLFHWTEALPVIIARPGNPYGPHQTVERGQGFIGAAIAAVLAGRSIGIFGERGTVRDYIHVEDLAAGLLAALDCGQPGDVFNIGTGRGHDNRQVLDLLDPIVRRDGHVVAFDVLPSRTFDVDANVLDSSLLTSRSGWQPKIGLPEGIEMTWAWARRPMRRDDIHE